MKDLCIRINEIELLCIYYSSGALGICRLRIRTIQSLSLYKFDVILADIINLIN